jgi:chitodextrinase
MGADPSQPKFVAPEVRQKEKKIHMRKCITATLLVFSAFSWSALAQDTLWPSTATPGVPDMGSDSQLNLGVRFQSSVAGTISGIRFWKDVNNTGTHIGTLYTDTGTQLAQATFSGESASGWQQVNFTPVSINANTTYVAAYLANNGHWSRTIEYFYTSGYSNPPLSSPESGANGESNGCGLYNSGTAFPCTNSTSDNYWVDIVFNPGSVPGAPSNLAGTAVSSSQINLTWTASTGTVTGYYVYRNSTQVGTTSSTSYSDTGLTASTQYSYYVVGYNSNGNSGNSNTVQVTTLANSVTLWPSTATPGVPDMGSDSQLNLGVRFQSSVAGTISGIRFWKDVNNTGTHIGTLYTNTGTQLAQATFSGESASGWQQVNFTAVSISANTTYVAAYLANNGHWSRTIEYFYTSGYSNPPLSSPESGANGESNGCGLYNSGTAFPCTNSTSDNYWVDIVFNPGSGGSAPGAPTNLAGTAASSTQINLTWTASTGSPTGYYVYRNSTQVGTTSSTSYSDTGLTASTQYSYYVAAYNSNGTSGNSGTVKVTTSVAPAPTNLQGAAASSSQINLTWTASPGATGYTIFRNSSQVGTSTSASYSDTGLAASTQYSYYVEATANGVASAASGTIYVTTLSSGSGLPAQLQNFFPVGPWDQPNTTMANWASRNANTLLAFGDGSETLAQWDSAAVSAGLKYIRAPDSPPSNDNTGQPNLLAWLQPDEPCSGTPASTITSNYTAWKAVNANMPIVVDLAPGGMLGLGGCTAAQNQTYIDGGADWVSNDIYPVAGWDSPANVIYPNDWVGEALQDMAAISGGRPQFQIMESAEQNLSWCTQCPAPTPGQFHTEFWDAIINGARGVFNFPVALSPFVWDNTTAAMDTQITADYATTKALASVLQTTINPSGMSATVTAPLEAGWRDSTHQYFIVDNTDSNAHNSQTITLTGIGSATSAVVYGESRNVNIVSGVITDNFAANAVHIYQVN